MTLKDLITVAFSVTALLLSLAGFLRTRRIDRVARRQALIDKKYAAIAKEEELELQMLRLLLRITAVEQSVDSSAAPSLKHTLNEGIQSCRERSKRLANLNAEAPDDELEMILHERLGLLSEQTAILKTVELGVEGLEARVPKG